MTFCYAIVPDGDNQPAALFEELEDAMDWGLQRYGNDAFRIRYVEVTPVDPPVRLRAASA
jgi:hypothetical protein